MRNSFSSSFRDMTYDNYLKQRKPMCEIRIKQILARSQTLMYRLKRYSKYRFTRKYTNQEIKCLNVRYSRIILRDKNDP